jgi:hypothetical protein
VIYALRCGPVGTGDFGSAGIGDLRPRFNLHAIKNGKRDGAGWITADPCRHRIYEVTVSCAELAFRFLATVHYSRMELLHRLIASRTAFIVFSRGKRDLGVNRKSGGRRSFSVNYEILEVFNCVQLIVDTNVRANDFSA